MAYKLDIPSSSSLGLKRSRTNTSGFAIYDEEDISGGTPLNDPGQNSSNGSPTKVLAHSNANDLAPSGQKRPWKLRRQGSKMLSVLRSMTNSASTSSHVELSLPAPPPTPANSIRPSSSFAFLRLKVNSTVVTKKHVRPQVSNVSLETAIVSPELTSVTSNSSSDMKTQESKFSTPQVQSQSTGQTSLDSKQSKQSGTTSQKSHSSGEKRGKTANEQDDLQTIQEAPHEVDPEPVPTVVTVEKAASAKVYFECHYNEIFSQPASPRTLRLRNLELMMYHDDSLSTEEKRKKRVAWAQNESNHLRELRVMKSRGLKALRGDNAVTSMYEVVRVLGKGSFGVVRLVRERPEKDASQPNNKRKEIYAMKVIRKSDMLRNSQEGHLRAERDFLVASEGSRWIVPLIASFQDANNLFLVMEYMSGGDFLGLLIRENVLSEPITRFYIAQMILCVEEAHALRWIHRDVKPDNFLISPSGHLKISDFGLAFDGHWSHDQSYYHNHRYSLLAKLGINVEGDTIDRKEGQAVAAAMKIASANLHRDKANPAAFLEGMSEPVIDWRNRIGNRALAKSVVGTSQYMAPEVIRGDYYDARADWWSIGIILFECLYGHTPFLAEEGGRQATKANILNHKSTFGFPAKPIVSSRCQELIRNLLTEKSERLSTKRYERRDLATAVKRKYQDYAGRYVYPNDAEDIKAHRWFRDIAWEHLHQQVPPFVPQIKTIDDTHYFDEEEPISDFSSTASDKPVPTTQELDAALSGFSREVQLLAKGFVSQPHDTARLRKVEKEIDKFNLAHEQKEYLVTFVKHYGHKERKRPRDRLLRDRATKAKVMELRKKGAFLGYTYRRIRAKDSEGLSDRERVKEKLLTPSRIMKPRGIWQRARLSLH